MTKPIVSVLLITYNQQDFIAQAIESVLMQKVNFPYEIIIGEDLGTDGTRAISEEYAHVVNSEERIVNRGEIDIKVLPRTKNLGVAGNWCDCAQHAQGKYMMMLDGDDYWTDPNKMQMQVDFMEAHPECVVCHTGNDILYMNTETIKPNDKHDVPEGMILQDVLAGREQIVSSTTCLRADAVRQHIPFDMYVQEEFACEDWPTYVILSAYGEIRYLPQSTTVYRVGQASVTNEMDYDKIRRYWQKSKHMTECLYKLLPQLGEFDAGSYFDNYVYVALLKAAYKNNDYQSARAFAKNISNQKRLTALCARCWLTFKLCRILKK
jgi:glycosyltransferase involved in cell wall biosynthesis